MEGVFNSALQKICKRCTDFSIYMEELEQNLMTVYQWSDMDPTTICGTDFYGEATCSLNDEGFKIYTCEDISTTGQTSDVVNNFEKRFLYKRLWEVVRGRCLTACTKEEVCNYDKFEKRMSKMSWFIFHRSVVFAGAFFDIMNKLTVPVKSVISHHEKMVAFKISKQLMKDIYRLMKFKLLEKCPSILGADIDGIMKEGRLFLADLVCEQVSLTLITYTREDGLKEHLQLSAKMLLNDVVESLENWFGGDADELEDIHRVLTVFHIVFAEIAFSLSLQTKVKSNSKHDDSELRKELW